MNWPFDVPCDYALLGQCTYAHIRIISNHSEHEEMINKKSVHTVLSINAANVAVYNLINAALFLSDKRPEILYGQSAGIALLQAIIIHREIEAGMNDAPVRTGPCTELEICNAVVMLCESYDTSH